MPLRINISDTAIARNEEVHQLHLWGVQTSLWKNNCIQCGRETDETRRIRCNCGEGVFCGDECQSYFRTATFSLCSTINMTPVKVRPTSNHRRALVLHSDQPHLSLVWAEVKDDHLVIDHPSLDKCYGYPGIGSSWVDLAVINPACPGSGIFRHLGHGLAMAFSSTMMDPDITVDPKWRNKAITDVAGPGYRNLWAGPLVFFCYGYDISDYVKVNDLMDLSDASSGLEAGMTKLDILSELDSLRWEKNYFAADLDAKGWEPGRAFTMGNERKNSGMGANSGLVGNFGWRWKVKDEGTSMRILDLTHRDLNVVFDYLSSSRINAIPCLDHGADPYYQPILVQDANHPGYAIGGLWHQVNFAAQLTADVNKDGKANVRSAQGESVRFSNVDLPSGPLTLRPILGAFAVGLRWVAHFSMDINPPFRGNVPSNPQFPLLDLCWTIQHPEDESHDQSQPVLEIPAHTFDSALVMHLDNGVPLSVHHVRALYKYLRHTDPRKWARKGKNGFENYWEVYSRVEIRDSPPGIKLFDPWFGEGKTEFCTHLQRREQTAADIGEYQAAPDVRSGIETVMSYMSLEGLEKETPERRAEIVKQRKKILKVIAWVRKNNPRQGFSFEDAPMTLEVGEGFKG